MRPLELLNRYIELTRVFLEGRGMPFLGAGISNTALPPNGAEWKPTVLWMVEALIKRCLSHLLQDHLEKQRELAAYLGADSEILKQLPNDNAGQLQDIIRQLVNCRLGVLCEGLRGLDILNLNDIVAALQIKEYAGLQPTPAHYYIALLVAETLVNEVISTNYDCCLEGAVNHCWGNERKNRAVVSITDLKTYRQFAARRLSINRRSVTLRVYKINGCAGELSNRCKDVKHILLTERQLQHMDDRAWARDLLRDRARAKALVFSGFGSDEPQIKFTLQRLQEEFNAADRTTGDANSLWIHAYEQQLSSSQLDILKGFWGYHTGIYKKYYFSGTDIERIYQYCGSSLDKDENKKLSADIFWQTLFQVVFLSLVELYTRPGLPGWAFLEELDEPSRLVKRKKRLQQWLDPGGVGELVLRRHGGIADSLEQPLARVHSLLGFQDNIPGKGMTPMRAGIPLCLYLRALAGRPQPGHDPELAEVYYQPLIRQIKPILILLCLACFCVPDDAEQSIPSELPFEVGFSPGVQPDINRPVLLFNRPGLRLLLATEKRQDIFETAAVNHPHVTMLVGYLRNGSPFPLDMSEEWAAVEVIGSNQILIRRIAPVTIQDVLSVCQCGQNGMSSYHGEEAETLEDDALSPEIVSLLSRRAFYQASKPAHCAVLEPVISENG